MHIETLRANMEDARERMDNKALPFNTRLAARSMFHHCMRRIGTMERGGIEDDEPGAILIGYSELALHKSKKRG